MTSARLVAGRLEDLRLHTSRYQAADLIAASSGAPVGISLWGVRFKIPYEIAARIRELAPDRAPLTGFRKGELDWDGFQGAYIDKLEGIGVAQIEARLLEVAADASNPRLILCCFENVAAGEPCHRRVFARWWQEKTGQEVPEL